MFKIASSAILFIVNEIKREQAAEFADHRLLFLRITSNTKPAGLTIMVKTGYTVHVTKE